jgi:hypothetical protein
MLRKCFEKDGKKDTLVDDASGCFRERICGCDVIKSN